MSLYSFQQIADALGILKRSVEMRAKRKLWPFTEIPARGGLQKRFALDDLPDDVQVALRAQNATAAVNVFAAEDIAREEAERLAEAQRSGEALGEEELARVDDEKNARLKLKTQGLKDFAALPDGPKKQRALARRWVINAYWAFHRDNGGDKQSCREEFSRQFNQGQVNKPQWVIQQMPLYHGTRTLSRASLQRWEGLFLASGIMSLTDNYGQRKGFSKINQNPELKKIVLGAIFKYPHITPGKVKDYLEAEHTDLNIASIKAIDRFIKSWKKNNAQLWTYITNPDQWKNIYMAAAGSHFERIERLNQLWEMDSTPGDWMLTDGRHSVLGVIDMYSRRLKFFVSKTSKSMAVCQVFRRSILDWGVCEAVRTDNGADYVSEQFEIVIDALEVTHEVCIPFASEEKGTIERSMRTMSHGILDLLPGFIGHSVAERKVIEARKSFSDRIMTKGDVVEVALSSDELQDKLDQWADHVYAHNIHSGLDGKTPWKVASEWTQPLHKISDESVLDMLLAEVAGTRTVTKKGVRFDRHHYYDRVMFEHVGREAILKYDEHDIGRMAIYIDNAFICWAECPALLGISAKESANASKAHQKKYLAEQAKEYRSYKRELKDSIPDVVLAHRIKQSKKLAAFPPKTQEYTTPGLNAAADALAALSGNKQESPVLSAEDEAMLAEVTAELSAPVVREINKFESPKDRYSRWARIEHQIANSKKEDVSDELRAQLTRYQAGREYTEMKEFFEEFGLSIEEAES